MNQEKPADSANDSGKPVQHTPEEQAAFDERMETLAGYSELAKDSLKADGADMEAEIRGARLRGASQWEIDQIGKRHERGFERLIWLVVAIVIVMIIAVALFVRGGRDVTAPLEPVASSQATDIAPPEPAATPEEVLPPRVFTVTCEGCGEVRQVPLELNKDAKYQFAYDAGDARLAILTVVGAEQYDAIAASFQEAHEKATAEGTTEEAPKVLDDVADGAVIYGTTAVFKNGDDCGLLWTNTVQGAGGEVRRTVEPEQLEELVRVAAPRM